MSLPLSHAGGSVDGISAALDLRFASSLSLTSTSGLTPSFSRASTGTFFNSSGVLTTAAVNGPRFNHVYNGSSWVSKGLLVEEQRTNLVTYSEDLTNAGWTKSAATINSNSIASPDGLTTADEIVETTATANHGSYSPICSVGSGSTYTASGFIKKKNKRYALFYVTDNATANISVLVDLNNGTIVGNGSGFGADVAPTSSSITNVGNGWYRVSITRTNSAGQANARTGVYLTDDSGSLSTGFSYAGSTSNGIYAWGFQIEVASFPTSYIPSTGASSTVRSADVCQITGTDFSGFWNASEGSAVIEFDSAGSTSTADVYLMNASTSGAFTSMALFSYLSSASSSVFNRLRSGGSDIFNVNIGSNYTPYASAKIGQAFKSGDSGLTFNGGSVSSNTATFTLSGINAFYFGQSPTGTAVLTGHIARLRYFNKRLTNKQLEDLCKPEEQLKLDLNFSSSLSLTPTVGPTPSFSRASTGTYFNASGVLTTAPINGPRFDHVYNGSSWVSKGLLVEEQRTNINLYSEQFNNAAYSINQGVITANQASSPDGNTTAENLTASSGTVNPYVYMALTTANSSVYTFSIYVKKNTHDFVQIVLNGVGNGFANFNISSGVVGTLGAGGSATSSIVNVGNGWYRCVVTYTTASTSGNGFINLIGSATAGRGATFTAAGTESVYLWGQQLELGAFPTSYIPTTTAAVTRSADVCQITGSAFTNLWNATEGTISLEQDFLSYSDPAADQRYFSIAASSNSPAFILNYDNGTNFFWYRNFSGLDQLVLPDVNSAFKVALAFRTNDYATVLNGGTPVTSSTKTLPTTFDKIDIGYQVGAPARSSWVQRLRYYAIRLPNRLLIAKST